MIIKMVCAGEDCFSSLYKKDDDELLVAIDGGFDVCKKMGLRCDLLIGDFDSVYSCDFNKYSKEKIKYSPIKDKSDFQLALEHFTNMEFDRIEIYNATGLRLDHFYAILNILKHYKNEKIVLIDSHNYIYVTSDKEIIFSKSNYKYYSFYSIEKETVISIEGFKYCLNNYLLDTDDSLCLSNELLSKGIVKTNKPLMIIMSK